MLILKGKKNNSSIEICLPTNRDYMQPGVYLSLDNRLKTQHQSVDQILSSIDSSRIVARPKPGKWNIHENLAHLARYQPVFMDRINQILLTEKPSFGRYKAEEDPEFENWTAMDIKSLINQLKSDRKNLFHLIANLSGNELNRIGIHVKYGQLNILQWTEFFLLHEAHHIFTIFQLAHDTEL